MSDFTKAKSVFEKIKDDFLEKESVVGMDIGFKIIETDKRVLQDVVSIRIHVEHKKNKNDLIQQDIEIIKEEIDGVPIDIIQANLNPRLSIPRLRASELRTQRKADLNGGISVGGINKKGYGTLGAVVFDIEEGKPMILSNFHVLGDLNNPIRKNTPVFQPAIANLKKPRSKSDLDSNYMVAALSRSGISQGLDCAVAEIKNRTASNYILGIGPVKGAIVPRLGLRVKKSGLVTDITQGIIDGIYWTGYVDPQAKTKKQLIKNAVHIISREGLDSKEEISYYGDSGSLWVTENNYAVALHFAGELYDNPVEFALAYPILEVTKTLGISFLLRETID